MSLEQLHPYGFQSTLFDRLLPETESIKGLSIQELRQSVAND
ncbi:MAG: type VI secretion system baseplate subunit TssE, partial [Acinetobacter tandoii]